MSQPTNLSQMTKSQVKPGTIGPFRPLNHSRKKPATISATTNIVTTINQVSLEKINKKNTFLLVITNLTGIVLKPHYSN